MINTETFIIGSQHSNSINMNANNCFLLTEIYMSICHWQAYKSTILIKPGKTKKNNNKNIFYLCHRYYNWVVENILIWKINKIEKWYSYTNFKIYLLSFYITLISFNLYISNSAIRVVFHDYFWIFVDLFLRTSAVD